LLKHEILFLLSLCIANILFARLFYLYVVVANEPYPYSLGFMLTSILLPAIAIVLPIVLIGRFALGKYRQKKIEDQKIEIKGDGNYESLRLLFDDLICIQSSDNYVEVFYLSNHALKKSLIRNKLSVVAETFPNLLRIHRSFIVNPYHFEEWLNENSKPFLLLSHGIKVPISKTYLEAVKLALNFTTR